MSEELWLPESSATRVVVVDGHVSITDEMVMKPKRLQSTTGFAPEVDQGAPRRTQQVILSDEGS